MSFSPKFKVAAECYENAVLAMLREDHPSLLSIVTSTFVSLVVEVCKRNGHDTDTDIVVNRGDKRDITIHKFKAETGKSDRITALEVGNAELLAALQAAMPLIATEVVACHGMKCHEDFCMSCNNKDDAEAAASRGLDAFVKAHAAIKKATGSAV